jgi:hypothetical protein
MLYTDPEPATEEVLKYHDFDQTVGANINCDPSDSRLGATMEAADGTSP